MNWLWDELSKEIGKASGIQAGEFGAI